jgi:MATE family multidrug resistance protein
MIRLHQIREEYPQLLRLALPLIVAEIGWMLMNFVDLAMIGRFGATAMAAVSVGSAVFIVFAIIGEGLMMGLDAVASQAYGAGRLEDCHRALWAALQMAIPLALMMIAAMWAITPLLPIIGIPQAVCDQAGPFIHAIGWSLLALVPYFALRRYLQAMHMVKIITFAMISANLVNAFFNWVLIYGHLGFPVLGARGSGWSTTLARLYTMLVLGAYTAWQSRERGFHLLRYMGRPQWALMKQLLRLGAPAAGQIALEVGVFSGSTLLVGRLGPTVVGGHQIALSLASFTFMVPLGVSSATAVRVGNAVGRRDINAAALAGWTGVAVSLTFMSCAALAFWLIPSVLVAGFTNDPAIAAIAVKLLAIAAIFQLFDGTQVTAIGALRGSGDTRTAMLSNIVGWWIIGLPTGAYLCFARGWGAIGIWTGLCIGLILIGCVLAIAWRHRMERLRREALSLVSF